MGKVPLESSVENYLVSRIEKDIGGMALKGDVPGRRFLDRILILPGGATVYCECKRPKNGRYSRHQLETVERLLKLGHFVSLPHTTVGVDRLVGELWQLRKTQRARAALFASAEGISHSDTPLVLLHGAFNVWSLPHE